MINNKNMNIIDNVVNQDFCTGCGACVFHNHTSDWKMDWNIEGFLVPTKENSEREMNEIVINVCPFNPYPVNEVRTEDELSEIFLKEAPNFHPKVGRYYNTYAGYSGQFRPTSSSGGIATYILNELFEKKLVDAVITVGEGENNHYEYKLVKSKDDLLATSKTKYYPVTMADVLNELKCFDGKVAIVGIGCFIKAVRLLQHYNTELREKIVFTVGIICGGLKSKFFADYLAQKAGVKSDEYVKPQFRIKDINSTASDYSFGCFDRAGHLKKIKMRTVGDMWGTGIFKCNACDFCDDVTTELADISLGDAWLDSFDLDGRGTNVIVSRSMLAEELIKEGISKKEINVDILEFSTFQLSQRGGYNHRHKALKYRIDKTKRSELFIPPKRHNTENISIDFKLVQKQRMKIRKRSLINWLQFPEHLKYDISMKKDINRLSIYTKLYHYKIAIFRRLGLK